ncbi:MAG: TRAP transporter TatT component family protein [Myxococcota bacterium]
MVLALLVLSLATQSPPDAGALNAGAVEQAERDARAAWLSRTLEVSNGEKVLAAAEAWVAAAPKSAPAHVMVAQAAYWLGLRMEVAGAGREALERTFARGMNAGVEAQRLGPELPGGYYWDAVNRAKIAELKGITSSAWQLPTLQGLIKKVDALQPGYSWGGTDRYRAVVITRTPDLLVRMQGKSLADAEEHFRKALKTAPEFAATKVFWAELKIRQGDTAAATALLREVLDAPPAADPEVRAWNQHEKARARRMLDTLSKP